MRKNKGLTVVEVAITFPIALILITALYLTIIAGTQTSSQNKEYIQLNNILSFCSNEILSTPHIYIAINNNQVYTLPNCIEKLRGKLDLYKYPINNYDISISVQKDSSLPNIVNVNIQVYKKIQKRNVTLSTNISVPTYLLSNPNQFPLNLPNNTEATVKKLNLSTPTSTNIPTQQTGIR